MLNKTVIKYSPVIALLIPTVALCDFYSQSLFTQEDNDFYFAIGGGGAVESTGDWKLDAHHTLGITAINQPNDDTTGVGVGMAALGYGFENVPLRMEVAYNYIGRSDFKWDPLVPGEDIPDVVLVDTKVRVNTNTLMLNFFGDIVMDDDWIPYLMVGLGYGVNSAKLERSVDHLAADTSSTLNSETKNTGNFVWNAGVGINYVINENFSFGAQVAYVGLGKIKVDAVDTTNNNVTLMSTDNVSAVTGTLNIAYHFAL